MNFQERPLAITDVETTGLDDLFHEIIEIGLLVVDQNNFAVLDQYSVKIKPLYIERATKEALKVNGYNEKDWQNTSSLSEAMTVYSEKTKDAMFLAYNMVFDWGFIKNAFKTTSIINEMDYHRLDLLTLGWQKTKKIPAIKKLNLNYLCEFFGIKPETEPHRAINGVMCEYELLKIFLTT